MKYLDDSIMITITAMLIIFTIRYDLNLLELHPSHLLFIDVDYDYDLI